MIQSMTGFATKTITITKGTDQKAHITILLKSLNSRYFELNAKLPQPLSHLETELIKRFKKELHRGYLHFIVTVDNPTIFKGNVQPSMGLAHSYAKAIKKLKKDFNITQELSLESLVRLPHIFSIQEEGLDKQSAAAIMQAADELAHNVIKERKKEGAELEKDLKKRIQEMEIEIAAIATRSHEHVQEQKDKLNNLTKELAGQKAELADARKSALYTLLDKIDVHEEIVRFKSHLENLTALLKLDQIEKGKRIDFTLQELAREINTIAAKCSDWQISKLAINIKVEIEKAREQAQNIV